MKKCVLLTCDDLSNYITDEDPLAKAITEKCELETSWLSWSSPVDWSPYDLAIVRTTWDYTETREEFLNTLEKIEKQGVRVYNDLSVIKWNSHKSYLFDLQDRGVKIIESLPLADFTADDLYKVTNYWSSEKILLKPFVGATSRGLKLFANTFEGADKLIKEVETNNAEWFVQPFMREIAQGEISLVYFNKQFSHGLKKLPKAGDFRSQEEFGSQILSYEPTVQEVAFGEEILSKIPSELLYARVDYILINDQPHLMELELVEPALYFRTHPLALDNFLSALKGYLRRV